MKNNLLYQTCHKHKNITFRLFALEAVIKRHLDFGKPTILVCFAGIWDVYEGKKNGVKGMFTKGIIELIVAFILLILFVGALFI